MEFSFSKQDTKVVKGIAIAMLMLHHCFLSVDRFEAFTISFYPLSQGRVINLAEAAKCCVGIFTFLSAYGMTKSYHKMDSELKVSARDCEYMTLHRFVNLFFGFAFAFAVCSIASFHIPTCNYTPVDCYMTKGFDELSPVPVAWVYMLLDLLGLSKLLGTPYLITTWWYIGLALTLIALMPLFLFLYREIGWVLIPALFLMMCISGVDPTEFSKWITIAPVGIFFAQREIFERWKGWLRGSGIPVRVVHFLALTLLMAVLAKLEIWNFERERSYLAMLLDGFMTVSVVGWIFLYLCDLPVVSHVARFFGRHSLNIFLVHNFIRYRWFPDHIYSFRNFALITLVLLLEATALSVAIELVKHFIRYNLLVSKIQKRLDWHYAESE